MHLFYFFQFITLTCITFIFGAGSFHFSVLPRGSSKCTHCPTIPAVYSVKGEIDLFPKDVFREKLSLISWGLPLLYSAPPFAIDKQSSIVRQTILHSAAMLLIGHILVQNSEASHPWSLAFHCACSHSQVSPCSQKLGSLGAVDSIWKIWKEK